MEASRLFRLFYLLGLFLINVSSIKFNCRLPHGCRLDSINRLRNIGGNDNYYKKGEGIACDVSGDDFRFQLDANYQKKPMINPIHKYCVINATNNLNHLEIVEFKWPTKSRKLPPGLPSLILSLQFNMTAMLRYFDNFYRPIYLHFLYLKGFSLHLAQKKFLLNGSVLKNKRVKSVAYISCSFIFYENNRAVKTCDDFKISSSSNNTYVSIASIFQMPLNDPRRRHSRLAVYLIACRFSERVCPLVFQNANIRRFHITNLVDTFYKSNLLKFWNTNFESSLNTNFEELVLDKVENIVLDTNLLNPYVFRNLKSIEVRGYVSSVDSDIFELIPTLNQLMFKTAYFRKLIHKNGIDWIKKINKNINFSTMNNLNDLIDNNNNNNKTNTTLAVVRTVGITLSCDYSFQEESMSEVFPNSDFCIYVDFPFDQFVFIEQICDRNTKYMLKELKRINPTFTCTYLWLVKNLQDFDEFDRNAMLKNLIDVTDSDLFENCDFKRRIDICKKSKYKIKDIWGRNDYLGLNIKIQFAAKIIKYLMAIFGIVTNLVVIRVIFSDKNKEIFKDLKHYAYLGYHSVFSIFILVIEILTWMTECHYPFGVFCPEIRKFVVIQLFKMLFKESLITALRFMCNFCYIAFALNRISLIGKDHGAIVKFFSKLKIKNYVRVAVLVSLGFSWIKFFKYSINFNQPEFSFPRSNEFDIFTINVQKSSLLDAYFIINSITDLVNYVFFVIVCFSIDIYMIVKLRRVLKTKVFLLKLLNIISLGSTESKLNEFNDAFNKSSKMVFLNTAIGIIFKLPLAILPVVNTYAQFYYKEIGSRFSHPKFDRFYLMLFETGFYVLIYEISDLLYSFSLSIQLFIYNNFDKKFKAAFLNLRNQS